MTLGVLRWAIVPALTVLSVWAQTSTSQLSGTVADSSGARVPGATVTATHTPTGTVYRQQTTDTGLYAFPSVAVGPYTVKAEATGFKTIERTNVQLVVNTPQTVDFALDVGVTTEVVQVEANAETLQTANATIGNVVEQKAIVNLPLNGRNPLNLLVMEPGVVQRSGGTISVNGSRSAAVNVTIDGIEANESTNPSATNNIFRVNPDNVQEFKVTTSNPTAEEGRNSGANISIATRSGTNEFHGSAFEFFRNTALNAQEFYANAQGLLKPEVKLNQYGFEIGGPIRRNRTFFFYSWQDQKVNFRDPVDKQFSNTVNLYTQSALDGNFRYFVVDPNNPFTLNGQRITQTSNVLVDPRTGALAAGVRNCGGAGDTNCVATYNIFANDPLRLGLDRRVGEILSAYPRPNAFVGGDGLNVGNYAWNAPFQIRGAHQMARVDHTFNEKHTTFFRALWADQSTLGGDPLNDRPQVLPGYAPRGEVFRPAKNFALGFRSVLTPRVVNELTLGYSRFTFLFTQGEANPLFPNTPAFTFQNSAVDFTNNPRTFRAVNTPQIVENLSVVTGSHVLKFGGNFRFYQHNDQRGEVGGVSVTPAISTDRTLRSPTGFTLPALQTATTPGIAAADQNRLLNAINDLLGIPSRIQQVFLGDLQNDVYLPYRAGDSVSLFSQGQRLKQYNLYAQDEWRLRQNLTVSVGLRWELNMRPTEAAGRVYVPNRRIDGSEGLVTFVKDDTWYKRRNLNALAPRLALTWSPDNKTVFRTGYAMAFDTISSFQVTAVSVRVPGTTFRCSSTIGGTTTPGCAQAPDLRLGQGFPSELPPPTVRPSTFLTPPLQTQNNAPGTTVFDPNLKIPTVHQWNFQVQRELPAGVVLSVGYVGRRGTRLFRSWDANQIDAAPILPSFRALQQNFAINGCRPDGTLTNGSPCPGAVAVPLVQQGVLTAAQATTFLNSAQTQTDLRQNAAGNFAGRLEQTTLSARLRPNQQFAQINYLDNGGDSNYHGLQVAARRRFDAAGLLLAANYTLGKSIDNLSIDPVGATSSGGLTSTSSRTPADGRNYDNERARSDFDQRHVVTVTGLYELPFGRGKKLLSGAPKALDVLVGGWSVNTLITYQSGEPFTVRSGVFTHNFSSQSRAALVNPAQGYPEAKLQEVPGVVGPVFFRDASAFRIPEPGEVGIGRNVFQGPSFFNTDLGVTKAFALTERVRLLWRTEFFNAFNHPNFRNPRDASVGSPSIISPVFAQACCVTLATASSTAVNQNGESWRVIQFALKLQF